MSSENQMDWMSRIWSAGIGGFAALLALGISEPKSRREAMARIGAGVLFVFCFTGATVDALEKYTTVTHSVNTILAVALVEGSIAWYILGAIVAVGQKSSLPFVNWGVKKIIGPSAAEAIEKSEEAKK